jgi:hypothetical protein
LSRQEKEAREGDPAAWPCGSARCSNLPGRAQLAARPNGRYAQTGGAKSVLEVAARRPTNPARLAHAEGVNSKEHGSLRVALMGAALRAFTSQIDGARVKSYL